MTAKLNGCLRGTHLFHVAKRLIRHLALIVCVGLLSGCLNTSDPRLNEGLQWAKVRASLLLTPPSAFMLSSDNSKCPTVKETGFDLTQLDGTEDTLVVPSGSAQFFILQSYNNSRATAFEAQKNAEGKWNIFEGAESNYPYPGPTLPQNPSEEVSFEDLQSTINGPMCGIQIAAGPTVIVSEGDVLRFLTTTRNNTQIGPEIDVPITSGGIVTVDPNSGVVTLTNSDANREIGSVEQSLLNSVNNQLTKLSSSEGTYTPAIVELLPSPHYVTLVWRGTAQSIPWHNGLKLTDLMNYAFGLLATYGPDSYHAVEIEDTSRKIGYFAASRRGVWWPPSNDPRKTFPFADNNIPLLPGDVIYIHYSQISLLNSDLLFDYNRDP